MKIGFFGGSFDPIHIGHLHLALRLLEVHGLDQVIFCPAGVSPHKQEKPPQASAEHRLKMVQLAIQAIDPFVHTEWEVEREGPSYTIDTLRALSAQAAREEKEIKWHLILGEDALQGLNSWKEAEELIVLAPPLIGSRFRHSPTTSLQPPFKEAVEGGMTKIHMLDISSTDLRHRLAQGLYCGHLLPKNVLDYIRHHKLYLPR